MKTLESKQLSQFKALNADVFAWVYSNANRLSDETNNFGKKILGMASLLDHIEADNNLVESIRKKVGINPADKDAVKLDKIFPEATDPTYEAASGWGEYVRKIFNIDLGAIEEFFDEIIEGLTAIYNYIKGLFVNGDKNADSVLNDIDIVTENLKTMRSNTPLLVHIQTKLEMSQSAKMSVA